MNMEKASCHQQWSESIAGGVAHDLNNILSLILGNISLAMGFCQEEDKPFAKLVKAEQAALRARDLAQQLSFYADCQTSTKKICDLAQLTHAFINSSPMAAHIQFKTYLPEDLWLVKVDQKQFFEVLKNLVVKIVQAVTWAEAIQIRAENVDGKTNRAPLGPGLYVKISVGNQYVGGMADFVSPMTLQASKPMSDERSFNLKTADYLINRIMENHGGQLELEQIPSQGVTFHMYLPAQRRKQPVKNQEKQTAGKGRILIMDDDQLVRSNAGMILQFLGYEAEFAGDGEAALTAYVHAQESHRPFQAVLMDLSVRGGMGGKDAVRELLSLDPKAKAIAFSGYSNDPVMQNYKDFGFCGVIKKPYTIEDFRETLRKVLR